MDTTRICLDTGLLISYLKGREPGASATLRAVRDFSCSVTAITAYELLFGLARSQKPIGEDELLGLMTILPFDGSAARRAAYLHDELLRAGLDIGIKDTMIAAIALENQIPLLTLNERHFLRVPNLQVLTAQEFISES
jgi:tRNA(fMet)-specific endonuclease VapC